MVVQLTFLLARGGLVQVFELLKEFPNLAPVVAVTKVRPPANTKDETRNTPTALCEQ